MYIIIIGGGKAGYFLTKTLLQRGHEVALIERDEQRSERLQEEFGDIVVHGECDPELLEEAGASRADILIAVTGRDETNLVVSLTAKELLRVPRVIARVFYPTNRGVFNQLGIELTVSSTDIICNLIEQEAIVQEILPLLPLKKGELEIVEIRVPAASPAIGMSAGSLPLPPASGLIALIRGEDILFPRADTTFFPHDTVLALTATKHVEELKKVFYR